MTAKPETTPTTDIDAVALVRRIREAHHEELKDASSSDRIRFFRERAERLHRSLGITVGTPGVHGAR